VLAASHAIPAIYGRREFAAVRWLISYGESLTEAYRQIGLYAAKIHKGARTIDLPVMQLANPLGLTVPPTVLARAEKGPGVSRETATTPIG